MNLQSNDMVPSICISIAVVLDKVVKCQSCMKTDCVPKKVSVRSEHAYAIEVIHHDNGVGMWPFVMSV